MAEFIATTSRGLQDVLAEELSELGLKVLNKAPSGVLFESNWEGCYRANLELRTATRIIKPVLDFPAYQPDDLYHNIKKHDFTKYIGPHQTLALDTTVRDSSFKDQRFVTLKLKDGIVDQFRETFGERPDIDSESPDLQVMVRVVKNQVSVSIDTSGKTLSMRGYREDKGEAPLREHLAAGLLRLAKWNKELTIFDPMCGSGTFLIEAAMMARGIAPGSLRKRFAFQNFKDFKTDVWDEVLNQSIEKETPAATIRFYGSDQDGKVLRAAHKNAERAGVDNDITFERKRIDEITPPTDTGLIVVNPPYGERMGVTEELKDVYRDLAFALKRSFKGWTCWVLSGNEELTAALKLKATRRIPVYNGSIDCRFLEYKIN